MSKETIYDAQYQQGSLFYPLPHTQLQSLHPSLYLLAPPERDEQTHPCYWDMGTYL